VHLISNYRYAVHTIPGLDK